MGYTISRVLRAEHIKFIIRKQRRQIFRIFKFYTRRFIDTLTLLFLILRSRNSIRLGPLKYPFVFYNFIILEIYHSVQFYKFMRIIFKFTASLFPTFFVVTESCNLKLKTNKKKVATDWCCCCCKKSAKLHNKVP